MTKLPASNSTVPQRIKGNNCDRVYETPKDRKLQSRAAPRVCGKIFILFYNLKVNNHNLVDFVLQHNDDSSLQSLNQIRNVALAANDTLVFFFFFFFLQTVRGITPVLAFWNLENNVHYIHTELWKYDFLKATTDDAYDGDRTRDPTAQNPMSYRLRMVRCIVPTNDAPGVDRTRPYPSAQRPMNIYTRYTYWENPIGPLYCPHRRRPWSYRLRLVRCIAPTDDAPGVQPIHHFCIIGWLTAEKSQYWKNR